MVFEKSLDSILNSKSKIAIIRLFVSRTKDFKVSGREIAKLIHVSAPATHAALKELYNQKILTLEIIGKQHIYTIDRDNRIVRQILEPMFKKEVSVKEEIKEYLAKQIQKAGLKNKVVSVILYGSLQRGKTSDDSDVDIAVVVKKKKDKEPVENKFFNEISDKFYEYFKAHLDVYIKTKAEFRMRIKKNQPPVSTLMKSYSVILGKEPLEI